MLNRREFLMASAASLSLGGCQLCPPIDYNGQPEDDSFEHPLIDIHCHVFNARDVPVVEFGSETVLREMRLTVLKPFIRPLLRRYVKRARTVAQERDVRGLLLMQAEPAPDLSDDIAGTGLVLENVYSDVIAEMKDEAEGRKAAPEFSPEEIDAALADLSAELPIGRAGPRRTSSRDFAKSMSAPEARQLAIELAETTRERSTERGGLLAFLANMVRSRVDLTSRAVAFAGPSSRVRMITPSMNDYDLWYGIEPGAPGRSSPMKDQVDLAADIALHRAPANALVNGIVAYDPLRQVYDQVLGTAGSMKAIDVVRYAVRERGFVGVKIYPPMGYRPIGNSGRDFRRSPAIGIIDKITRTARQADPTFDFGRALDDAMDELYRFCLNEGVAILAHCSNSQSTFEGSGLSAAPAYWRQVLEKPSVTLPDGRVLDYRRLRLNLAHGAAIWCVVESGSGCQNTQHWRTDMLEMLTAGTVDAPRYPNLYCDMGDAETLTEEGSRVKIADYIAAQMRASPRGADVLNRILYGTDWFMLSKTRGYGTYLGASSAFFRDLSCRLGDGRDYATEMLWRNAARHLGLVPDGATYKRLKYFYRHSPAQAALLDKVIVRASDRPGAQTYDCVAGLPS